MPAPAAVLAVLLAAGAWRLLRAEPALPVYKSLPGFSLTDSRGRPFTRADLLGKVWIANLIYTRCEDTCPLQAVELARILKEFDAETGLRILSVSVDSKHDTPEVLARYALSLRADPDRWHFLTGDEAAIARLAREGFSLAYGTRSAGKDISPAHGPHALLRRAGAFLSPPAAFAHHATLPLPGKGGLRYEVTHSARFILLGRKAQIRGYYLSEDSKALRRLRRHARILLRETP